MAKKEKFRFDLSDIRTEAIAHERLAQAQADYDLLTQKKVNKGWMSLAFLAINVIVVLIIALVEFGGEPERIPFTEVFYTWIDNYKYLLYIVGLIIIYYLSDTLRTAIIIKKNTGRFRFGVSARSSIMCKYYDNMTPLGAGGQPFQIHYLSKHIPAGPASSLPIIILFLSQLVFFVICIVNFIIFPNAVPEAVKVLAYVGASFYVLIPGMVLLFSFLPRLMSGILSGVLKLGCKIKIGKKPIVADFDASFEKITTYLEDYRHAFKSVGKSFWTILIVCLLSALHYYALMSIPYCVVMASGATNVDYFTLTAMTFYVYSAITFVPTPGNSGAAESLFYIVFGILEGSFLFWGMLLWRLSVYYVFIVIGLGAMIYDYIKKYRKIAKLAAYITATARLKEELANPAPINTASETINNADADRSQNT